MRLCSKSVFRLWRRIKRISTDYWHALHLCSTHQLLQIFPNDSSRSLRHWIIVTELQGKQIKHVRTCARVFACMSLSCMCVGVCHKCHGSCDQMFHLLCCGKQFSLKCHFFVREGKCTAQCLLLVFLPSHRPVHRATVLQSSFLSCISQILNITQTYSCTAFWAFAQFKYDSCCYFLSKQNWIAEIIQKNEMLLRIIIRK